MLIDQGFPLCISRREYQSIAAWHPSPDGKSVRSAPPTQRRKYSARTPPLTVKMFAPPPPILPDDKNIRRAHVDAWKCSISDKKRGHSKNALQQHLLNVRHMDLKSNWSDIKDSIQALVAFGTSVAAVGAARHLLWWRQYALRFGKSQGEAAPLASFTRFYTKLFSKSKLGGPPLSVKQLSQFACRCQYFTQ